MQYARMSTVLCLGIVGVAGCQDSSSGGDGAAAGADAGVCGTYADPGKLKLAKLTPAIGASVVNQAIVHGFTVVGAPAVFTNFELRFGDSHTAGLPTPANPKFPTPVTASDLVYQLTIDSWSRAPGHVELVASTGYETSKGCWWIFPAPLFSYDVTAGPDGGLTAEAGGGLDTSGKPVDATTDGPSSLDVPDNFDLAAAEATSSFDAGTSTEAGASLDGASRELDAAMD